MTTAASNLDPSDALLTIDELAAAVGVTVRTTRYYATLGLVPPPVLRGRTGYYGPEHRARLELVRALTDHGFTLAAVEGFVADLPADADVEELALRRAMLTSWSPQAPLTMSVAELERTARRRLSPRDLEVLAIVGAIEPVGGRAGEAAGGFRVLVAHLPIAVELLDVDVAPASLGLAEDAIRRHMDSLADELTTILHTQVLEPYRRAEHAPADAARLERTMAVLRRATLEGVVVGFRRAANEVITRSLAR